MLCLSPNQLFSPVALVLPYQSPNSAHQNHLTEAPKRVLSGHCHVPLLPTGIHPLSQCHGVKAGEDTATINLPNATLRDLLL